MSHPYMRLAIVLSGLTLLSALPAGASGGDTAAKQAAGWLLGSPRRLNGVLPATGGSRRVVGKGALQAAQEEELIGEKARLLCRYHLQGAPVLSRLPREVDPAELMREEDLAYARSAPAPLTQSLVDEVPGFYTELASFVRCVVTRVEQGEGRAVVEVRQERPRVGGPGGLAQERLLAQRSRTSVRALLKRWMQRGSVAYEVGSYRLDFVQTAQGWRADFQLPERAAGAPAPSEATEREGYEEMDELFSVSEQLHHPARQQASRPPRGPLTQPVRLGGPELEVPQEALRAGVRGVLKVRCKVLHTGELQHCQVQQGLPYMEQPVLKYLYAGHYAPPRRGHQPVDADILFTLRVKGQQPATASAQSR